MAQTLPASLYDPVLNLEYTMYQWYENTTVVSKLARTNDPTAPVHFNVNNAILSKGGQFIHSPVWKPVANLISRRDMTITTDATPLNFSTRDDIGVRVSRKIGPISITRSAEWMSGQNLASMQAFFNSETTNRMALDMRNFILGISKAVINNMAGQPNVLNVYNATTRTTLTTQLLTRTRMLVGDMADVLFAPAGGAAFVIRSESHSDLIQFQQSAGVRGIADRAAAGMTPLTLDLDFALANDPALIVAGSPFNEYDMLLLGPGFMEMDLVQFTIEDLWMNPKAENVEFVLRGNYDLEFKLKGVSWDTVNGGGNPTLTTASTPANWLNTYTDPREIAGCLLRHNATAG